ncbi:MAG: ABC transporter ATP-binding protein [Dehalococcoidia bacterium]
MQATIDVRGLTKRYGNVDAVANLSFTVQPGEVFGFLGPNGAGKTTTIRMLTGLLKPTHGTAIVAGHDILQDTIAVKRRIGFVADGPFLYPKLTAREFLDFIGELYGVDARASAARKSELLALFGMDDKADELLEGYSHGMRQKIALAGALLHDPSVLFLDEPTSGLDPRSARIVKDLLRGLAARGCTVFMSTHVMEIAEAMCDRVGIIDHGELVAIGAVDDLRRQARADGATLEDIFLHLTGAADTSEIASYLGAR